MNYTVESEQSIRLDIWLAQKLGQSRSQIQKLIKSGVVTVNGKVKTPHAEMKNGDVVEITQLLPEPVEGKQKRELSAKPFDSTSFRSGNNPGGKLIVVFESPDYLIVEKPEGMVVHHDAKHKEGTLVDWVLEKYPEVGTVGDPERPGIVHRLDKEVSGLLVVARTERFYEYVRKLFDEREIKKEYVALVLGKVVNRTGTVEFKLVRSKNQEKYIGLPSTSDDLDAKAAVTHYEVVAANHHYSLLKLFPETGRTHQLRVHMRTFGHPIAGDRLYQLPKFRHLNQKFQRVFLHARSLSFNTLNGELVSYTSDVPIAMREVIEDIFHVKEF